MLRGLGFASAGTPDISAPVKRQENVMWQRNHPQDKPTDTPASALRAVQVALDRRDNGGDVHTGDDE